MRMHERERELYEGRLYNICGVIKEDFASTAHGASIDLDIESDSFLGVEWNGTNDIVQSTNDIFEIPCILGAGYACSRKYWLYLHGLRGLRLYGVDEQFISLKVWLTGGKCKLINSIELGHVYRTTDIPYQIENIDLIYNRMLVSRILLPKKYYQKYEQCIKKRNTNIYNTCSSLLKQNLLFINAERKYFQSLITRDLNEIICMNKANFCSSNIRLNIEDTLANCMSNPNITHNNSLFWGKTGLSFIYMLLARKNKDTLYEKTAKLLIQQVWTDCGVYTNLSFASGLLGIITVR